MPPPWLGTRVLPEDPDGYGEIRPTPPALRDSRFTLPDQLPALPGRGFASRVASPPPADVIARSTWRAGCPVGVDDLAWIRLTFWGFDDQRHTGELLANASVADDLVSVFRRLYAARFPIEEMAISTRADQDAPPTGDGNATEVVQLPADDRRHVVLPARLRPRHRRGQLPEPLRQGRPRAPGAGAAPTSTATTSAPA